MIVNNFEFLIFSMWKETERPQGIGLWSPGGLDYRTSTGLGKQTLAGCKQNLVYTRTQKGEVTPQEAESDLPVSVRSLWWRYGRQWPDAGLGHWTQQVLLKENATTGITPTIVWTQAKQYGENTAPPINRKLD